MYFNNDQPIVVSINCLPTELWGVQGRFSYKLTRPEKKRFKKRRPIPVSHWCERHRVITKGSIPGRWRNETTAYLAGIMDASYHRSVEEIVVCAAPQTGKSETVNNCIAYSIDRDPGDVLYVYPDELTSKENNQDRIQPMIKSSRRLSEYLTGYEDDLSNSRINLSHMTIYMAWAKSAARLANKPIAKLVLDEIDKYPETSGKKESDPISLAEKRLTTFRGRRKKWKISSPTIESGPIWGALNACQVRFVYWVRCPDCGGWQVMALKRIRVPEGERDSQKIETEELAWYACAVCKSHWDDARRNLAVRQGQWREQEKGIELKAYLTAHNPKSIGFQILAWLSPFVSLSEVMAAWFKAQKSKTALKDFMNGYAAEPWIAYEVERRSEQILALADDRPSGMVPGNNQVACLTFAVDTQDDGFWFQIVAWGWGLAQDCWVVRSGFVTSFEALEQVLWGDAYKDATDRLYTVRFGLQDAMGHRTGEVYDFCRKNPGKILPTKGEKIMNQPFAYTNIEYYPGSKKPIPGNIKLVRVNTKYFKDRLAASLEVAPADPGSVRFPVDFPPGWADHYTVEFVNEKGDWDCRPGADNHLWDCNVLNRCAAEIMGVRFWKQPAEQFAPKPKNKPGPPQRAEYERPGWLEER